jgi:hypothetical protein
MVEVILGVIKWCINCQVVCRNSNPGPWGDEISVQLICYHCSTCHAFKFLWSEFFRCIFVTRPVIALEWTIGMFHPVNSFCCHQKPIIQAGDALTSLGSGW